MNQNTRSTMAASIQVFEYPNGDGTRILAAGYANCNRGMLGERPLDFGRDYHVIRMRGSGNLEESQLSHEVNP
jgi:hypothetical protein